MCFCDFANHIRRQIQEVLFGAGPKAADMSKDRRKTGFRQIQSFVTEYAPCNITQYVSERSGMQVIVAHRKGPKVNGYFALATEIFDDSGAPHTLEHLVFMGSKSYQYKGLLDKLASRAYSTTNAWTATDHTAYTLDTAGWEGFAQILPVYLEHVILPVITDEACLTEVHYVDGEGTDAGVVYSEMQAVQYRSGEIMDLKARRLLYPENVGFRYETGGMTEMLRKLSPERIRQFHRDMYQPRNLCVVVVGEADHENLLEILDDFEESIKDEIPPVDSHFKRSAAFVFPVYSRANSVFRPWIDSPQPPPLSETIVLTAEFPEEDESVGEIAIGFFGPSCIDQTEMSALAVLLTYLCGSSVSVLENVLVEKEELASSVSYWFDSRPNSVIWLQPTGVATDKLEFVEQRLLDLLKEVASQPLDMDYINACLRRESRQIKFQAEEDGSWFATNIINDYLFGHRDGSTLRDLQSLKEFKVLEGWKDEDWREFLQKYISNAHHISVLGKPSLELAIKLKSEEEARIAKRKEELGPDGLAKLGQKLEDAKKKNDEPIPASLIDKWPVPGTESIHFIESDTARSGKARDLGLYQNNAQKLVDAAKTGTAPIFVQFEDVPTNFVHLTVYMSTSQVPVKYKPLTPIFIDNFFNTPIMRNGERIEFEQVVMELQENTVSYGMSSTRAMGDPDGIMINFVVEPEKYAASIEWIRAMMFDSIFDPLRLKAGITKQLADIPEAKRDGKTMAAEVDMAIHMDKSSLSVARRTVVKAVYFRRLKALLEKEPETVLGWFEELRKSLFTFENMRCLVIADVAKLKDPVIAWDTLTQSLDSSKDLIPITAPHTLLNEEGTNPGSVGAVIVPMTTLDTSFSVSSGKGVAAFSDPRLPALLVAISYLEAAEGPLWTAVRGQGFAYSMWFSREIDSGMLQYKIYRSPDASKAISASHDAIRKIAEGEVPIDRHLHEGAISQIVTLFADEQSTMAAAASQNFVLGVVRGLQLDWNTKILLKVRNVTEEEIRGSMKEMILPLFESGKSNVVVTCATQLQEV
jgi:Zn-dependent M16 (insulinase) family peptidase